jgi:hypothetical protein
MLRLLVSESNMHGLPHRKLSERIRYLTVLAQEKEISLREVEGELAEKGSAALICFLCVPFLFPIPIPGISTMFGAAIIALALKIMVGQEAKLPEKWAQRIVPKDLFSKVLSKSIRVFQFMEKFTKPRLNVLALRAGKWLAGISMIAAAIGLAIPIPPIIPLTNTIPAMAIFFLALGLLDEDGLLIILGHVTCVAAWIYLLLVGGASVAVFKVAYDWIMSLSFFQ